VKKLTLIQANNIHRGYKVQTQGRRIAIPDWDEYLMTIAVAVAQRANCLRGENKVGAILVKDRRIISTGYNGTPSKAANCLEAGCQYCRTKKRKETCTCVHAEQNALLAAARFGIAVDNAEVYTTVQPCFSCSKELLQARIRAVYYVIPWGDDLSKIQQQALREIQARFPDGTKRINLKIPTQHSLVYDSASNVSALKAA